MGNITVQFKDLTEEEARHYINAMRYYRALDDLREWLRGKWKHGEDSYDINDLYDEFCEITSGVEF